MRLKEWNSEGKGFKSPPPPQMIPDKHPETSDSPSLPRRAGGAVSAPLLAFHQLLTVWLLISSIISPICCPGKGKVPWRHPHFQSFNLMAAGAVRGGAAGDVPDGNMQLFFNCCQVAQTRRRLETPPPERITRSWLHPCGWR